MSLNKQSGNMYGFITHTVNFVGGECLHRCIYCYMRKGRCKNLKKYQGEARIIEKEMKTNLGSGNFIFVGSATDMFGCWVSDEIIKQVLDYCKQFDNKYLFQSKNPHRFLSKDFDFPEKTVLGTTIETNRYFPKISDAPPTSARVVPMEWINYAKSLTHIETMVSIEPIMDFDLEPFVDCIKRINPEFVSIGADSKGSNLSEPSPEKIRQLIKELDRFTDVRVKPNLRRLRC